MPNNFGKSIFEWKDTGTNSYKLGNEKPKKNFFLLLKCEVAKILLGES